MENQKDKLDILFEKQKELQIKLGTFPLATMDTQAFINIQSLALIDEIMEALRETPWKPWKKTQQYNELRFQEELVDAWHFLINITLASGMSSKDLYRMFINKNIENHARKENGY